ncbi:MAG: magnesium transporter [Proteobacteria bacterium]|nr:magnesium transporter [Pseudomonadota bacterium]
MDHEDITSQVKVLIQQGDTRRLRELFAGLHPADVADLIEHLPEDQRTTAFGCLTVDHASEVMVELEPPARTDIVEAIQLPRLAQLVDEMDSDDATDIIADLRDDQASQILDSIDAEDKAEVETLLEYEEDTAGGLMQLELISARRDETTTQVIARIRAHRDEVDDVANVFVIDAERRVVGVAPLQLIVIAGPDDRMKDIMVPLTVSIGPDEDQEEVARKFRKYSLLSAPVVSEDGTLLGRITVDDVMDAMEEEMDEDVLRMAGTAEEEIVYGNQVFKISRVRLPWLITNLLGALFAGYLLSLFEATLTEVIVLITFVPVMMAMGGNVGIQSSAIMVRGFAVGRITLNNLWPVLYKELRVGAIMGLICGLVVGLLAVIGVRLQVWTGNPMLGLVVGLSMFCAVSGAAVVGTLTPAFFKRINIDPAIASGPFVTTAIDIISIVIYLSIATAFISALK